MNNRFLFRYDEQDYIRCPNCNEIVANVDSLYCVKDNYCSSLDWSDEK